MRCLGIKGILARKDFFESRMKKDPVLLNDWHVVARSEQLVGETPLRAELLGESLVLWRADDGSVQAWQDLCIHRGARLSLGKVSEGLLKCAYHGWTYDQKGQCVRIPAHPEQVPPKKACTKTFKAIEKFGWIWASLGSPKTPPPAYPAAEDPSYRLVHCGPYRCNAAGPRIIENILDVGHFPFVHAGILGEESRAEIGEYEAEIGDDGVSIPSVDMWQPDPDGLGQGKMVNYSYRVPRPLNAQFTKNTDGNIIEFYFSITPISETCSEVWMSLAMNYGFDLSEAEIREFQDRIVMQDVPVVESQHPELLPLDLQAELHLRSDRAAIAYRKWLNQIGLSFGTA